MTCLKHQTLKHMKSLPEGEPLSRPTPPAEAGDLAPLVELYEVNGGNLEAIFEILGEDAGKVRYRRTSKAHEFASYQPIRASRH